MYLIHFIDAKNYMVQYAHLFKKFKYLSFGEEIINNALMEVENFRELRKNIKKVINENKRRYIFDCYKYKDWFNKINRETIGYLGEVDMDIKSFDWLIDNREWLDLDCEEKGAFLILIFV